MFRKKSGVYIITNLSNGNVYIGIARNLGNREVEHFRSLRRNTHFNSHFQRAYNKYGEESFQFNIYKRCDIETAKTIEVELIAQYRNSLGKKHVYNMTGGGEGGRMGLPHTKETKEKISFANSGSGNGMFGRNVSQEERDAQSERTRGEKAYWFGKKHTEETKRKIGNSSRGRRHTEADKRKQSLAQLGKKMPPRTQEHTENVSKKVFKIDLETGKVLDKYISLKVAASANGMRSSSKISMCCKGKRNSAGGYKWEYAD